VTEFIDLGGLHISFTRKAVKHAHLSVHPPSGEVTLVAPTGTRLEVARAYAISRLSWIRSQQAKLQQQAREAPRRFVARESHYVWGRRYLLQIVEKDAPPQVTLDHKRLRMQLRPGSTPEQRARLLHEWHKRQLHAAVPPLIHKWEQRLGVTVNNYYLQRMKTKWGSCNHRAGNIRLNTELVKKPLDLLDYVVLHEMAHLIEPAHNTRFMEILAAHYPGWREARDELNALPLAPECWFSVHVAPACTLLDG
jgi:predicted metal-dependent hydrolase